jgi:putative DNA primase/helicase
VGIADVTGGDWPKLARQTAVALSGEVADESTGVQLLADLRELFDREPTDVLFTKEILAALGKNENRPWPEWKNGKPITDRQLATLLKPFKVRPKSVRWGAETDKGYRRKWFDDAFARYLPALQSVTASQASDSAAFGGLRSVTVASDVTDTNPSNASVSAGCDGVTDRKPDIWVRDIARWPRGDLWGAAGEEEETTWTG